MSFVSGILVSMDVENYPQTTTPSKEPVTQPVQKINKKKIYFLTFLGAFFLLTIIIGGGVYYLGIRNKNQSQLTKDTQGKQQNNGYTNLTASQNTVPKNWKTYKNTKYGYTVSYPATIDIGNLNPNGKFEQIEVLEMKPVSFDQKIPVGITNSVCFDAENSPYFGPCPYYISVISESQRSTRNSEIYNSLSQQTLNKIFALRVGQDLDKKTTQDVGGNWEFPTRYKRLPDETVNGLNFIVIENPKWYGGSNRILFLRKNGNIYITGITYQTEDELKRFQQFYSSLKFSK